VWKVSKASNEIRNTKKDCIIGLNIKITVYFYSILRNKFIF